MRQLLNLLDANRTRGMGVKAEQSEDRATIYLYDAIGIWGVEAAPFVAAVRGLTAKQLDLRINSPGGDVFDARAMKAALADFDGTITAYVDGLSASAASFLMMEADEIVMTEGAFVMIHNAWGLTIGNAEDHRTQAGILDKVDDSIVADYASRTGKDADELRALMAAETWFDADAAVAAGFANRVQKGKRGKNALAWNLSAYRNAPAVLAASEADAAAASERARYEARLRLYERA